MNVYYMTLVLATFILLNLVDLVVVVSPVTFSVWLLFAYWVGILILNFLMCLIMWHLSGQHLTVQTEDKEEKEN